VKTDFPVIVVEGEKDVNNLEALGFVVTSGSGGAGKWLPEYAEPLNGGNVIVIPDNDEAGRKHAEMVARSIAGKVKRIRMLELPGLPEKGDASD
jgi:DNA primase